jgi:hypothetical protein
MDIFLIILRTLLLTIGALMAAIYFALQLWQPIPSRGIALKGRDYFFLTVVAFLFGFGLNNELALLAFIPLLLARVLSAYFLQKNKLHGKGRWMEIEWRKFTPKGFQMPKNMQSEISKLPGDVHFVFPRFASLWAVKFVVRSIKKNASKVPQQYNGQQGSAVDMIDRTAKNIAKLDKGKTEQMSLPFGLLRITRL